MGSSEEELSRAGRVLSRTGSRLCYNSFPSAENEVKGRKGSSRMASEEATAQVQARHEGGWMGWWQWRVPRGPMLDLTRDQM